MRMINGGLRRKTGNMKIGRNKPCPCGSGKKYKKCCLEKDEQKALLERKQNDHKMRDDDANLSDDQIFDDEENVDQHFDADTDDASYLETDAFSMEQINQFWKTYQQGDFNQKVSIVEKSLEEPDAFRKYDYFELISALYDSFRTTEDFYAIKRIINTLKINYPDIYENDFGLFTDYLIRMAMASHNHVEAIKLMLEFTERAADNMNTFCMLIDYLSYYFDVDILLEIMHRGWKSLKDSYDIMAFEIRDYVMQSVEFEIFKYVRESTNPDPEKDSLLKKIEYFTEPDLPKIEKFMSHITGKADHVWTQEDFNYKSKMSKPSIKKKGKPQKNPKKLPLNIFNENVNSLSGEFLEYLINTEGYFFPKARIAHLELRDYIKSRAEGNIENKYSLLEKVINPKSKMTQKIVYFDHILCPDKKTTGNFISMSLTGWNNRLYCMIIFYESIPAWLKFLELKGLIDDQTRQYTLTKVFELFDLFKKIIMSYSKDYLHIIPQIELQFK